MKKLHTFILTMLLGMVSMGTFAQNCIRIHNSDKTHNTFMKLEIDNIKFSEDKQTQTITTKNGNKYDFDMAKVDSVTSFNIHFLYNVVFKGSIFDKWWSPSWEENESRPYIELNRDGSIVWRNNVKLNGRYDMDGSGTLHIYMNGFEAFRIVPTIITEDFFCGKFYVWNGEIGKFVRESEDITMMRNIPGDWSIDYNQLTSHKWGAYIHDEDEDEDEGVNETIVTQFTTDGKVKYYIDGKLISTGTYTLDKTKNILTTKAVIDDEYEEIQYRVCNLTDRSIILFEIVTDYQEDPDGGEYTELRTMD